MSRGKKLGLLLMILLLLTVGTLLTENRTAEVTEAETEEDTVLFDAAAETLSSLSWTWEGETITLLKDGENWSCGADPDFPLSSAKTEALVKALYGLRAEKTIDKPGNLSEYGLDAPVMSITVSADTETTFEIGSGSSLDGYLYVSKGDGRVCLVDESLKESFSCGLYDLVRKESLPDMSDMTCLSVDSEVGNYEIAHIEDSGIAYTDQYEWFLKNGDGWLTLDNTQAEEFVDQIRFLAWQECVDYRADETALISYGLDEPAVTAEILYTESRQLETDILADDGKPICDTVAEEKSFVLEIGDYVDSFCYARLAGSPMVYKIAASVCDSLLYMSYDELRPGDVILLDRDELTEAEVTVDGESHTFTKSRETVSDENGENSKDGLASGWRRKGLPGSAQHP
ncbi:MAG: DUF4340 domain-containing protein [Oscillospiraceae bacterium]|nr:DUF4340 domain-containing protein [Oscillospiraceae bacterium]